MKITPEKEYFVSEICVSDLKQYLAPLNLIADSYGSRKVPRSNNFFHENIWIVSDGLGDPLIFDFEKYVLPSGRSIGDQDFIGLQLFLKVMTIRLFEIDNNKGQPYSTPTIHGFFTHARAKLIPFMEKHGILYFDPNSRLFRSMSSFSPSLLELLVQEIQALNIISPTKFNIFNSIAHYISEDMGVPAYFRPPFHFFRNKKPSDIFDFDEKEINGHKPIPDNDYYWIGKSAIEFMHYYGEDIIRLHECMVQVWKTSPPDHVKAAYREAIERGISPEEAKNYHLTSWRLSELLRNIHKDGIKLPDFSPDHQRFWNVDQVSLPPANSSPSTMSCSGFTTSYLYYLFQLLFGSLSILLLIPTGMRNSELRLVDINHVSKTPNKDGIFSYVVSTKKIKPSGTFFRPNEIPIPLEAWHALHYLNQLTTPVRNNCSSFICVLPLNQRTSAICEEVDEYGTLINFRSRPTHSKAINEAIADFCRFIGSATIPTSHRFRKSLAEFMLCKTRKAPILICQLFGHRSITMTLKYLKRSSLIKREVKEYAIERFRTAAAIVAKAISTKACAGPMVRRFVKVVDERFEFRGLTQAEMMLALEEWIMDKIKDLSLILIHTPVCICCRSTNAKDKPPCTSMTSDESIAIHVDPASCTGAKCEWSLFTCDQAAMLENNLVFYQHLMNTLNPLINQNQHLLAFASDYVETYDPIAKRIKQISFGDAKSSFTMTNA